MSSLPFPTHIMLKHIGELTFIGDISIEFLCGPLCFLFVYCVNSWFIMVYCSSSNVFFKIAKKTIRDPRRSSKTCLRPSNTACLFIEIYWSVGEAIVLERIKLRFKKTSPIISFSPKCFHLNRVENWNKDSSTETHFKRPKTSRGPYLNLEIYLYFCQNIWVLSRDPVPLTLF